MRNVGKHVGFGGNAKKGYGVCGNELIWLEGNSYTKIPSLKGGERDVKVAWDVVGIEKRKAPKCRIREDVT